MTWSCPPPPAGLRRGACLFVFALYALLAALLLTSLTATAAASTAKPVLRVGIIGSGISGASSAYWVHSLLKDDYDVRVTVWERDHRMGGRIADVHVGSHRLESGASILHASNRYMREFATMLNLTLLEPPTKLDGRMGIWDGHSFPLKLDHRWGWMSDAVQVFWRYGLDYMRLEQIVRHVAKAFNSVYELQEPHMAAYESPRALLEAMGVWSATQVSFHDYLHMQPVWLSGCKRDEVDSELILRELASAATRVNYGQSIDIHALAGAVGLIPMTDGRLWSVSGGNARIIEGLLHLVDADVRLGHAVDVVERVLVPPGSTAASEDGTELRVSGHRVSRRDAADAAANNTQTTNASSSQAGELFSDTVDVVVVATPLELAPDLRFRMPRGRLVPKAAPSSTTASSLDATAIFLPQPSPVVVGDSDPPREFQTTHATFVSGRLRPAVFGLDSEADLPATILTTEEEELHFTSIAAYAEEEGDSSSSSAAVSPRRIYKIFSRLPFGNRRVSDYFSDVDTALTTRIPWRAYPRYTVPEEFAPSFTLYRDVYYPLAMEPAASCMEVQTIASKNVAMLIAHEWREKLHEQENRQLHDEL